MNASFIRRPALARVALAAVLLAGSALGGVAPAWAVEAKEGRAVNPVGSTLLAHALPDFSDLVTQVRPAVVSITTRIQATQVDDEDAAPRRPTPFDRMNPRKPGASGGEARGSGFVIDANGTIVTNNHVVKDATSVSVTLDDGTVLAAKVVGRDPRTDIAVLKVSSKQPLPYIQMGNSRDVKPGEWAIAVGNPFGLGGSVTAGIVSAISRDIGAGPYDQFIQIDAPINQGNSGGPLFTQDGKVIGMNTAILSPSGGSVGIGFAIPSDMIRTVAAQLVEHGRVTRGYVGVETQQIVGATAKGLKLTENSGALLANVQPDSPAARAGLEPGDVIQAVNGQAVATPRDLALNVAAIRPGEDANLKILRDGAVRQVTVKVGELPGEQQAATETARDRREQLGLALGPLSPELRNRFDVPDGLAGAVVQAVRPGSASEQAGLKSGDVIVGVGNQKVANPAEAVRAIRSALASDTQALALRVFRDGRSAFVGIPLDRTVPNAG